MTNTETEFDVDKIATAINQRAEEWKPTKLTIYDKLKEPKIFEAIKNLRLRGANGREVCEVLKPLGIETTPQTLNAYLSKIEAENGGVVNAKRGRKPKQKPAETAEIKKPATSEAAKPTATKPESKASEAKPATENTKGRKLTEAPNMGGAFNPDDL